ncbi:hypothetical protein PG995_014123 [Apiospora arundinis]
MLFQRSFAAALLAAVGCLASPTPPLEVSMLTSDQTDAMVLEGINLAHTSQLERRLKADFSMAKKWNHEVLFDGGYAWKQDNSAETVGLAITCLDCETKGSVTAKLWEDLLHPSLRLQFNGVEAYILLGLNASTSTTVSVNLFASNTPIGLHYPGLSVGVVFFVDLVFTLDAHIDMSGGFYVKLADDAFLQADIFKGDVKDYFFDGIKSKSLPITVATGSGATFKADLRLRVQVGAEAKLKTFGIGAGAAMGIYANLVEFVAAIETTPTCALETREWFDLNVGAYARLDVVVDYKTLGLVPTVSTTLLSAPTLTQCWIPQKSSGLVGLPGKTITTSASLKTAPTALPMVSSTLSGSQSSRAAVSGSKTTSASNLSASRSTSMSLSASSLPSAASVTAKYTEISAIKVPTPVSSTATPSVAFVFPLNGTGKYPVVTKSGSHAASSSLFSRPSSLSSVSSSLPAAASITGKHSSSSISISSSHSTATPSPPVVSFVNGTGKYPTVPISHVLPSNSQAIPSSQSGSPSLPAAASITAKPSGSSSITAPPSKSTAVPPVAQAVISVNGTGRLPQSANASSSLTAAGNNQTLVTTTLYSTAAYTATICAAGVANCPKAYQREVTMTKTIDSYTTICPAGAQVTWPAAKASPSSSSSAPADAAVTEPATTSPHVVTEVIALTKVPSPTPETFVPPPVPAPTAAAFGAASVGEGKPSAPVSNAAAAAAFAAFAADYQIDNTPRVGNATFAAAPVQSFSSSSSSPTSASSSRSSSSSTATGTGAYKPTQTAQTTSSVPLTAGGVVSYAVGNVGLVVGSIVVSFIMLG